MGILGGKKINEKNFFNSSICKFLKLMVRVHNYLVSRMLNLDFPSDSSLALIPGTRKEITKNEVSIEGIKMNMR